MKFKPNNFFVISTPSQMINAVQFIYHFNIKDENNLIVISCTSQDYISQIKQIGSSLSLEYCILFSIKLSESKLQMFNRIPLKLIKLYISKIRIKKIQNIRDGDRLVLGNYSNFICQYFTQQSEANTYLLDDGTGTIYIAEKRITELKNGIPMFESNFKKRALWLVKLLLGFYNYKISPKFTFFSSYEIVISEKDQYVFNNYSYLKNNFSLKSINVQNEYFIGSPLSEVGYVTQDIEIELILNYVNQNKLSKLFYIPHRKDSLNKINRLKESMEILNFNLPIEFALSKVDSLPEKFVGFCTSAFPNLVGIVKEDVLFVAIKIPEKLFIDQIMDKRVSIVYESFKSIDRIQLI